MAELNFEEKIKRFIILKYNVTIEKEIIWREKSEAADKKNFKAKPQVSFHSTESVITFCKWGSLMNLLMVCLFYPLTYLFYLYERFIK